MSSQPIINEPAPGDIHRLLFLIAEAALDLLDKEASQEQDSVTPSTQAA